MTRDDRGEKRDPPRARRFPWDDPADADPSPAEADTAETPIERTDDPGASEPPPPGRITHESAPFPWDDRDDAEKPTSAWDEQAAVDAPARAGTAYPPGGRRYTLGSGEVVVLASRGSRLGARIIDMLLMGVIYTTVLVLSGDAVGLGINPNVWGAIIVATLVLYEVPFVAMKGQTPGKMVSRLAVVRTDVSGVPGWRAAIARWAIPGLLVLVPVVGGILSLVCYVSLTWHRHRQGWHDMAARTVVIDTGEARQDLGRVIGAFVLSLVAFVPSLWLTIDVANDPASWMGGWLDLSDIIFYGLLVVDVILWIPTLALVAAPLRRWRHVSPATRSLAVAALALVVGGLISMIILLRIEATY